MDSSVTITKRAGVASETTDTLIRHGNVREVALRAAEAGISVAPPADDGTKRPFGPWKQYMGSPADLDTVSQWYSGERDGVGLVTGRVSGNLECFEFDDGETFQRFKSEAPSEFSELIKRIESGYCESTPSGGIHWLYRLTGMVQGNTRLASRPVGDKGASQVLIETRGEGGWVIIAPSGGRVHPSGGSYQLLSGGLDTIITLTPDEHEDLWAFARTFDEVPWHAPTHHAATSRVLGIRPGDEFNSFVSWEEVLVPLGWTPAYESDAVQYWTRPGKASGTSATTNYGGTDLLYVFSTSTGLVAGRAYDKFGAYAELHHSGDFVAAAKALRNEGFGKQSFPLTDLGNAERLAALFGAELKYVAPIDTWFYWDSVRWAPSETGEVQRKAKDTVRRISNGY